MKKTIFSFLAILGLVFPTINQGFANGIEVQDPYQGEWYPVEGDLQESYTESSSQDRYSGSGLIEGEIGPNQIGLEAPPPPDDGVPSCSRTFYNEVSTVPIQSTIVNSNSRALAWGFTLTSTAKSYLGPLVTVSMPNASVNGQAINPPYSSHVGYSSSYNFHGSLKNYQYKGKSGGGTLQKYDIVYFTWLVNSVGSPQKGAYRYIRCRV